MMNNSTNLQAELQRLQWQKLSNESNLKASLLKIKLDEKAMRLPGSGCFDHGLNKAIEEEMSKELRLAQRKRGG